ncbi:hypothetical protein WG947_08350 [Pontibacter sp. H259]|uniref:hypothetical protein n=1 Tax=Pontibacter sp. H259 TaxID=3133421 RepID=UPI0030C3F6E2
MGTSIHLVLKVILFSLSLLFLTGCDSDAQETEALKTEKLSEEKRAQHLLITQTHAALKKWFRYYNLQDEADTLFKLREVWETDLLSGQVTDDWQKLYKANRKLFKPDPSEKFVLDLYTSRLILEKGKRKYKVRVTSPDSEAAIVDPKTGEKVRLIFCNAACQFHDGWWRNEKEIIVVGLIQGFDNKTLHPAIWHINLYTQHVQQFTAEVAANPDKSKNYLLDNVWEEL